MAHPVPLVVHVEDAESRKSARYAFLKSPVRVGRSEINDLHLDRPYVSTWHGLVQFEGERITFVDLGSTNGTTLDGVPLEKNVPAEIHSGSELRIGSLRLQLALREAGDAAPAPRPATQFSLRASIAQRPSALQPAAPGPSPAGRPSPPVPAGRPEAPRRGPGAAPPPAAGPPPPSDPARDHARAALEDASWQLQVLHDAYVEAKKTFDETAASVGDRVPAADHARFRALLAERFEAARPAAAGAGSGAAAAPAAAPDEAGAEALSYVRAFAESYLPAGAAIESGAQVQSLLEAVADTLETSATSYIELRRGYEEFGKEMGLRVAQGDGPVARARDARQLLAFLLQRSADGAPRARELASAFADLMIHQVALLNGVTEGGKALLAQLSPEAVTADLEKEGASRLALGVKALREGAQWRAYLERYRALTEDDEALTDTLFGREFARAYSAVAGRRAAAGEPEGEEADEPGRDDTPRPGPAGRGR